MTHSGVFIDGVEVPAMGKSCLGFDMFLKSNLKPDSIVTYVTTELDFESLHRRMKEYGIEVKEVVRNDTATGD